MEYITKETVLKMLNKIENAVEDGEGYQFNEWVGYVEELPAEEVQPIVRGVWIDLNDIIQCSNCETLYPKIRVDSKHYCERCGSKNK